MTNRERLLAVIHGRELDRVPFIQYHDIIPSDEAWALLGRDTLGVSRWSSVHTIEHPNCHFEEEPVTRGRLVGVRRTLHAPAGQLTAEVFEKPEYGAWSTHKHFVTEPKDYPVLLSYLRDAVVSEAIHTFLHDDRTVGDDGLCHVSILRTPYQQLWVEYVSIMDLALHLADCPELVQECMDQMAHIARQVFQIVRKAPIPYVVFPDNITAPMIGDKLFRQHCLPLYAELADMLADRDIPVFVHMDGDLKALWQAIGDSKIRGIDSLSPPPDNDTSAGEAAAMWPHITLGLNFPSSVHLAPPAAVYDRAARILEEAGHTGKLWIQISETVAPGMWKKSFPEIARAIRDFGKPHP